jgi:hypothetical protein
VVQFAILIGSFCFVVWYFIIYPIRLHKRAERINSKPGAATGGNKNFNEWLSKKFNSGN